MKKRFWPLFDAKAPEHQLDWCVQAYTHNAVHLFSFLAHNMSLLLLETTLMVMICGFFKPKSPKLQGWVTAIDPLSTATTIKIL